MLQRRALLIPLILAAALALGWQPAASGRGEANADEAFRYPAERIGDAAELKYVDGLPVLVAGGTPEEIGTTVGRLAIKPAPRALEYPRDLLRAFHAEAWYGLLERSGNGLWRRAPVEYRTELDAMARGAGVNRDALVVGNTMFDLYKLFACSSLLVPAGRSATGGPLLGRNLDYPSMGYIQQYTLVTVYRPAGKHAFAAVGFPGLVGCLSGMNDAGLALAVLEVHDVKDGEPRSRLEGIPYALCHRKLLEECTTIGEAKKLLESLPRTTVNNLVVADHSGVAVFEITPGRVVQRDVAGPAGVCTNHFCTAALKPAKPLDIARSFHRFATLTKSGEGDEKLGPDDVRQRLDAVNLGRLTLQTMVFEPAALRLHLAFGEVPASSGPLHTLDLGPLFKGEPARPGGSDPPPASATRPSP
jgi:hypothetical protein